MADTVPSWQRCPSCGGALPEPVGTLGRAGPTCPDCGRVAIAPEHTFYGLLDSIEYDFDDVTPHERAEAADLLVHAGIPFRWDDGYRLLVSTSDESAVDALFGQVAPDADVPPDDETSMPVDRTEVGEGEQTDDGEGDKPADFAVADGPEPPDFGEGREPGDYDVGEEPAEWVADERSVEALGRLFDASDRLRHHPDNSDAAVELADATGVVLQAPLPFGVNEVLWETAGRLAQQLVDLVDAGGDPDDVITAADALRTVLRDHI